MDYNIIKKMIENKAPNIKPLSHQYTLSKGIVFLPPLQIDDVKSSYLVIDEKDPFFICVRMSFQDEKYAGPYDLIDNHIIIETWNSIQFPVTSKIKGYKRINNELIHSVIQVRCAWLSGLLPDRSFHTGNKIHSDSDKQLFHTIELQANESLQKVLINETKSFPGEKLWINSGTFINLTNNFKKLKDNGNIYTLLENTSLNLIWQTTTSFPPPIASIREVGSNLFSIIDWKLFENQKKWQFSINVPVNIHSIIFSIENNEMKLEILPSFDKDIVFAYSPLYLILFFILNDIQLDPDCTIPDDLLDFGFNSLEKNAIEDNSGLKAIEDKIGFALLAGLFCEGISKNIKLELFKWVERNIEKVNFFNPITNFQKFTLRLLRWKKDNYKESAKWFYQNNYNVWSKTLRQYKDHANSSVIFTEKDLELKVLEMIQKWDSFID